MFDLQKEPNSARGLISNRRSLRLSIGLGQQDARLCVRWANDNPALRPAVVGERGRIFDQFELQGIDEEANGGVVVGDDDGDELEMRHLLGLLLGPFPIGYVPSYEIVIGTSFVAVLER